MSSKIKTQTVLTFLFVAPPSDYISSCKHTLAFSLTWVGKKTHKWTTALPTDHNVVSHYIRVVNNDNKVDHVSE